MRVSIVLLLATALSLRGGNAAAQEEGSTEARRWTPATLFPPGARLAVVSGDPALPGETTAELSLPDGYRVPRHFHPMGERLEVRQGMLLVGSGEQVLVARTDTLRAGDSTFHPVGGRHFYVARGPTIIALTFEGPYTITYVNAYEAPRRRSFPFGY
jgi:quercetin dioxygenase-like cupin family protein